MLYFLAYLIQRWIRRHPRNNWKWLLSYKIPTWQDEDVMLHRNHVAKIVQKHIKKKRCFCIIQSFI